MCVSNGLLNDQHNTYIYIYLFIYIYMYIYLYMYIIYLWGGGGHEMKYIPQCSMAFCHTNNRILRDDHQLDIDVCFGGGEIIEMPQSSMAQLELATF